MVVLVASDVGEFHCDVNFQSVQPDRTDEFDMPYPVPDSQGH